MFNDFYKGKKVLVTGHTGFKGTWLCQMLLECGAEVFGYSLEPNTKPNLFDLCDMNSRVNSRIGDIRDYENLSKYFAMIDPEIVFHLAAQPIVRDSYKDPVYTYETNVMGTVNLLEAIRHTPSVKSVVNITTDKVYKNNEWCWGYREDEPLDGFDPYSNSKSCSELVTHSYINSFYSDKEIAISTARAGNVLGGGDFSNDRIIPDSVRAALNKETIQVRNPNSIRPYQHVLEPLHVYLTIAYRQYNDKKIMGYYNIGPDDCDCITTGQLVDLFCKCWGDNLIWKSVSEENAPHEATYLKLDCSKIKSVFSWHPQWHIEECVQKVCDFSRVLQNEGNLIEEMSREIAEFYKEI